MKAPPNVGQRALLFLAKTFINAVSEIGRSAMSDAQFEVDVTVKVVSAKAFLLESEDGVEFWCPTSQMDESGDVNVKSKKGDCGIVIIPEWLAIEKELM